MREGLNYNPYLCSSNTRKYLLCPLYEAGLSQECWSHAYEDHVPVRDLLKLDNFLLDTPK